MEHRHPPWRVPVAAWKGHGHISTQGASRHMPPTARAVLPCLALIVFPAAALAQAGPADPQVIAAAPTAKVNLNGRKIAGYVSATVRVGTDGKVKDVQVTENTTEGMDQALVKVLQSARF